MKLKVPFTCLLLASGCAHAAAIQESCVSNPQLYQSSSRKLEKLEKEDQADRSGPVDSIDWKKVSERDLQRRIQVATILAEGCFKEAKDYQRAALIFQHGDSADQYYQTFFWADEALKLGDSSQKSLVALGIDRYLVKVGNKQLFGSQLSKGATGQWCIEPIEPSFPEANRLKYLSMDVHEYVEVFLKFYNSSQKPEDVHDCDYHILKPSPAGTVPGFW